MPASATSVTPPKVEVMDATRRSPESSRSETLFLAVAVTPAAEVVVLISRAPTSPIEPAVAYSSTPVAATISAASELIPSEIPPSEVRITDPAVEVTHERSIAPVSSRRLIVPGAVAKTIPPEAISRSSDPMVPDTAVRFIPVIAVISATFVSPVSKIEPAARSTTLPICEVMEATVISPATSVSWIERLAMA